MLKKNIEIIGEFRSKIVGFGLEAILDIEPIKTSIKTRRKCGKYKDGKLKFAVLMWELNKPDGEELSDAIDEHLAKAVAYFKL